MKYGQALCVAADILHLGTVWIILQETTYTYRVTLIALYVLGHIMSVIGGAIVQYSIETTAVSQMNKLRSTSLGALHLLLT